MLRKALDAVQLVALRGELTVREIGEAMELPKSTAHRLVASLVEVRLLQPHRTADGDVYALGALIGELGGGQLSWRPLLQNAQPEMRTLADEIGETVGLHILFAERRVLIDQVVSRHEHRWVYNNQMVSMPLYAGAAAKMLLAMLPADDMHRLAERDHPLAVARKRGPRRLEDFIADLLGIRQKGFSMTSQEVNPGIASIAVPVIADPATGHPLSVLTLAGPTIRFSEKAVVRSLPRLRKAAANIVRSLQDSGGIAAFDGHNGTRGGEARASPRAVATLPRSA